MQEADDACGCLSSCIQERGSIQLLTKIGNRHTLIFFLESFFFLRIYYQSKRRRLG